MACHDREGETPWSGWARKLRLGADGETPTVDAGQMLLHFSSHCCPGAGEASEPDNGPDSGPDRKLFHLSCSRGDGVTDPGPAARFELTFDVAHTRVVLHVPAQHSTVGSMAADFIAFLHS